MTGIIFDRGGGCGLDLNAEMPAPDPPICRHVLFIEKPGEITALLPDKDGRSVMQFKYDPVGGGNCYFLGVQIAFNVLEIAGQPGRVLARAISHRCEKRIANVKTGLVSAFIGARSERVIPERFLHVSPSL